jgi:hypothetical protein
MQSNRKLIIRVIPDGCETWTEGKGSSKINIPSGMRLCENLHFLGSSV